MESFAAKMNTTKCIQDLRYSMDSQCHVQQDCGITTADHILDVDTWDCLQAFLTGKVWLLFMRGLGGTDNTITTLVSIGSTRQIQSRRLIRNLIWRQTTRRQKDQCNGVLDPLVTKSLIAQYPLIFPIFHRVKRAKIWGHCLWSQYAAAVSASAPDYSR